MEIKKNYLVKISREELAGWIRAELLRTGAIDEKNPVEIAVDAEIRHWTKPCGDPHDGIDMEEFVGLLVEVKPK